ncbi:hypothetical protein Fmac_028407 [Flemingia macrophylla]|uniref:Uncharacterized protein n=1 Tax=Flemingia macrophylla TaxID=520843 RepID=A0ABD1L7E5_9FABA
MNEAVVAPCASHINLPKQSLHITVAEDKMKTNDVGALEPGGEGTAKVSRSKDLSEASKFLNSSQAMSGSVSSSKWRELLIYKKATVESAKEVWDFGRTLGLVCEGDEEEVTNAIHC